ncbi:glycosyltransferase [Nannocystis sp. SCPEA4]|uniref:glycosyltransferase n=1 Tax=Nannocystis sp. SCPEA4 TaxID=2996787 RepID=UPI00226DC768|nr:glycosyltransferase [Nannocystis sp. SCPEA4]
MRVLVVTTTFPQWAGDPRGRFILRHWEARAAAGETVRFLVPRTAWVRGALASPCEVVRFAYAPTGMSSLTGHFGILENIRDRPWRALLVLPFVAALQRALQREIRAFRPDKIAAHMLLPCGWLAAEAARAARVPCELYGHGTDVDLLLRLPGPLREAALAALAQAESVALPSAEKLARVAAAWPGGAPPLRVETMVGSVSDGAGLEGHALADMPTRTGDEVLFLGRLIKQKGVDDLLRAAALMPRRPRLAIAGDGPERRRLQGLAEGLQLDARFHGFVEGAAKEALYRRAALLCVPSREIGGLSEGAPLVIAEAKRYGLPVVATAVGGIPELMRDLYPESTLVRPGAPQALAQALSQALAQGA